MARKRDALGRFLPALWPAHQITVDEYLEQQTDQQIRQIVHNTLADLRQLVGESPTATERRRALLRAVEAAGGGESPAGQQLLAQAAAEAKAARRAYQAEWVRQKRAEQKNVDNSLDNPTQA